MLNRSLRSRALLLACFVATPAGAQVSVSNLGLSEDQVRSLNAQLTAPASAPGIAFGSPIGFGADWGQAFAGIGGQTQPPSAPDDADGSAVLGLGIGDSIGLVGLEGAVTLISVTEEFAHDGNVNVKLHRAFPGLRAGVAVGAENTGRWGDAKPGHSSRYLAFTAVTDLAPSNIEQPIALSLNIGVGDERFAEPGESAGVFASVALAPMRQCSLIADWTGRDLNGAVSIVPFGHVPLVVTLGAININERFGNDREFSGGLGFLMVF